MPKLPTILGPLLLVSLYFSVIFVIRQQFPDSEAFIESIKDFYGTYGYPLVFFGALFEATFLIGLYLPGATVVLLGAALSRTGVLEFPLVFILGTFGLCTGYSINYFLGRYGWYHILGQVGLKKGVELAKDRLTKHGDKAIFLGFIHPSSASLLSTAAGITRMPLKRFLSLSFTVQLFWSGFWGGLAYHFGFPLVEFLLKYFIFVLLGVGAVWIISKLLKR